MKKFFLTNDCEIIEGSITELSCKNCPCLKIENKETGLCASCGIQARKEERQAIKDAEKNKKQVGKPNGVLKKQKPLAKHSDNVHYEDSNGIRYSSKEIEKNIHDAKAKKGAWFMSVHGYEFCEQCKRHHDEEGNPLIIDNAHIISVDQCKKKGMVELAWDTENNLKYLCRDCHSKYDRNYIQWTVNNK